MTFLSSISPLSDFSLMGSDEYRYDREPSTTPMLPRVYEVAKFGEEREETLRRRPRGVSKSRRAGRIPCQQTTLLIWKDRLYLEL